MKTAKIVSVLTSVALAAGALAGCSASATSQSVVPGHAVPDESPGAGSSVRSLAAQSTVNGGVGLPDAISKIAISQKGAAKNLVTQEAGKKYDSLVKAALVESLGPAVTKVLGNVFGQLVGMATGMIFDQVFGTLPTVTQVTPNQINAAIENLHADMTARFDSVDIQLNELNHKADAIIAGQAQAAYSKAYKDIKDGELARLEVALHTQAKVAQLLSMPELSEAQAEHLKLLVQDFEKQSHQIAFDLTAWKDDIVGVKEGTETAVPGLIAAYQELVTAKRRYMSSYEYQAIKAQALRWQSYSVLAVEVALTGARMDAADGIEADAHLVAKFVGDGGGADAIQHVIPASNWAPTKPDGTPDPNGAYLLDTVSGSVVVQTDDVKVYPPFTYISRKKDCHYFLAPTGKCGWGRTPKWRPITKGIEDHLARNFNDEYLKPSTPRAADGSLLANGSQLVAQYLGQVPADDEAVLEARKFGVPAGTHFNTYWPSDAVSAQPITKDARVVLGSDGYSYAQGGDEDVRTEYASEPVWVSAYYEKFNVWTPKKSGAQVEKETAIAQYKSRLCGWDYHDQVSPIGHGSEHFQTAYVCDKGLDQKPVYTGYKKSVKPVAVEGTVIWYVPLTPDQLGRRLNLVGVPNLH